MRHFFLQLIAALSFVVILWAGGFLWFITLIPGEPINDSRKVDAIVVLTGGSLRLEHGFELMRDNRAERMFISGVEDGVTLASLLRKKEYQAFAGRIDSARIELGYKARSTTGNAEETAQWIAREHIQTILLVTGNYHMPRSSYELQQAMPEVTIIPEPVFPKHFEHNDWWQSAESVKLVISEYHKYVASIIGHKILALTW